MPISCFERVVAYDYIHSISVISMTMYVKQIPEPTPGLEVYFSRFPSRIRFLTDKPSSIDLSCLYLLLPVCSCYIKLKLLVIR